MTISTDAIYCVSVGYNTTIIIKVNISDGMLAWTYDAIIGTYVVIEPVATDRCCVSVGRVLMLTY